MWGIAILAVILAVAVRALVVRHLRWGRGGANLVAFALCPLLVLVLAFALGTDDSLAGGLALMIFLPVAVLVGSAAVALIVLWEILAKVSGFDPGDRSDGSDDS